MGCKDKDKFKTAEAATKASLRTRGAIDAFLNILDTNLFRKLNKEWSADAKARFNITGNLFSEEADKAVPNKAAFVQIDNAKGIFYNTDEQETNQKDFSTERVERVLEKMGVSVESLNDYAAKNPDIDLTGVNGLADLVQGIIAIADGQEGVVLTEEMVHIATAIVEQTNPSLISELISKIAKFPIYKETLEKYKNNKNYQLPNGKPDIRKIKKEAVDKMITSIITENNEQADLPEEDKNIFRLLWNKVLNFINTLYTNSDIKLFEELATDIIEGNVEGDVSALDTTDIMFNLSEEDVSFQDRIMETEKYLRKQEATKADLDPSVPPEEQDSNWYERFVDGEWVKVTHRVTDRVKEFYHKAFGNKTFTEKEEAFNEFKRDNGVKYHGFFEDIWDRFYNADGTKRAGVKKIGVGLNTIDKQIYSQLETYFTDLMKEHTIDGVAPLMFSEIKILDPNYGKTGEAGTIDLLIRDANGVTHIYDWKFMTVGEKASDIAWYKQTAYDKQLGRYKDILRNNYGVEKFGKMRAVPVHLKIETGTNISTGATVYNMKGITIGHVSSDIIDDLTLTPVSESSESTGNEALDKLIKNLNSLHTQLSSTIAKNETEKEIKAKKLNDIKAAIRNAQTSANIIPLLSVIKDIKVDGDLIISEFDSEFSSIKPNDPNITEDQLSNYSESIREYLAIAQVFGNIQDTLGDLLYNPTMDDMAKSELDKKVLDARKKLFAELQQDTLEIRRNKLAIEDISKTFADKFIGRRNLVNGLLNAEAIVKGFGSWFDKTSEISLASVQILYKMVTNAKDRALRKAVKESDQLMDIRQRLVDRGVDLRELSKKLYQQKDGKFVNHLVYKFKKDFYEGVKENARPENRSRQWLKDNIDIEGYKQAITKIANEKVSYIKKKYANDEELKQRLITEELQKWDFSREDFNGWDNYVLKRFPKQEKWYSDEYLEIKKDADLSELYDFIVATNEKATELGYISNEMRNTFLPFVRKSTAEALSLDGSISPIATFFDNLKLNTDDVGFGKINEITKEVEYGLPKYYTHDFTKTKGNKAEVSEDIFKNLLLYVSHLNKYEQMSQIEEQLKLVKTVETFKNHLATSRLGNVILDKGEVQELAGNEENTKMFDTFLRGVFYEQKYALDDSDVEINTSAINFIKKKANNLLGKEVFDIDESNSGISLVKSMDTMNRLFQLKTLGLDLATGMVNAFGGNVQLSAQSGNYFRYSEVAKREIDLTTNRFKSDDEREMLVQLIDTFMPLKEDPMYERIKNAGLTKLTRANFSDWLMVAMRVPEQHIEKSVFLAMLDNTMVVDGKLVNIREHVKKQFANRYDSVESARNSKGEMESMVKELQKTKSVSATKELVDGKLVIPGFDNNIAEIQRLGNLVRRISRNATGNMSEEDRNRVSMNVWLRSFMVFKNWIPPLLKTRFGEFRKISDDFSVEIDENGMTTGEKYDVGRIRLWFHILGTSLKDKTFNVYNIMTMNEQGLAAMEALYKDYAAKYEQTTGQKLNMSKEDFYDMVRTNLRNQMKEILVMLALAGLSFATGFVDLDDDEDKAAKNRFRYMQRTIDKFVSEISFFYNPAEFDRMLSSGGVLPAVGLFTDLLKFTDHMTMELTGLDISDPTKSIDDVREKAHPMKYGAKMLPVTKTLFNYMGILSPEFAEEFDVTISNQTKR